MNTEQITEINAAVCAQGAGLVCKFFTDAVENKTLHPTLIEGLTWAAVSLDTLYLKTGLYGEMLGKALVSLVCWGVLQIKEIGGLCFYFFFDAPCLRNTGSGLA